MQLQSGWALPGLSPKPCDACKSSPAAVFCRADSAYLCLTCDSKIHCANKLASRHRRVWMCEVCEQAPAAVTCKADAAALCVTCDADIHSANPLASRHERVPIESFVQSTAPINNNVLNGFVPSGVVSSLKNDNNDRLLLPNQNFRSKLVEALDMKPDMFLMEMESFYKFHSLNSIQSFSSGLDSVVPVDSDTIIPPPMLTQQPSDENCFDIDFCRKKLSSSFTYPAQSISHSVSSSSLDVGIVPDLQSEISYPFIHNVNQNTLELSVPTPPAPAPAPAIAPTPGPAPASQATQLSAVDRELRVMRYREKRKNRKFQKTIRYASRKAYAETRPRIKGRFAKRTESETEGMDLIFNSRPGSYIDGQYGVVPTF